MQHAYGGRPRADSGSDASLSGQSTGSRIPFGMSFSSTARLQQFQQHQQHAGQQQPQQGHSFGSQPHRRRRHRSPQAASTTKTAPRGAAATPLSSVGGGGFNLGAPATNIVPSASATKTTYMDGTVFVGEWANGRQHGVGLCVYPTGNVYAGEWSHGQIHGRGTMLHANGDLFDGRWVNGVCDGEGRLFPALDSGAAAVHGLWRNGQLVEGVRQTTTTTSTNGPGPASSGGGGGGTFPTLESERRAILVNLARQLHGGGTAPPLQATASNATTVGPALVSQGPQPSFLSADATDPNGNGHETPVRSPALRALASPIGGVALQQQQHQDGGGGGGGSEPPGVALPTFGATPPLPEVHSVLLASAGPAYTTQLSVERFVLHFASMLLPVFSIPNTRCPLSLSTIDLEREYVVSGAALRLDFEAPHAEIYVALLAMGCLIGMAVCAAFAEETVGTDTELSIADLAAPATFYVIHALLRAANQSFVRIAHALERLDRVNFPMLAKQSSSAVDSFTTTCVSTWDEEGENATIAPNYRRRWALGGALIGLAMASSPLIVRGINGTFVFGGPGTLAIVAGVLSMVATALSAGACAQFLLKAFDEQRQVVSRMRLLGIIAYMKHKSVLRPTDVRDEYFDLTVLPRPTARVERTMLLRKGFSGWYLMRHFVLYASTTTNHNARLGAMSVVTLALSIVYVIAIVDAVRIAVQGNPDSSSFSSAHLVALFLLLFPGHLHCGFLFKCAAAEHERHKHAYVCDVAGAYHLARGDTAGAALVQHCRHMIDTHDVRWHTLYLPVTGTLLLGFGMLHVAALIALGFDVNAWARSF